MSDRDGQWIDEDGHCRVCNGEIPYGHRDNCEYFKLESQLTDSQARVKELEQHHKSLVVRGNRAIDGYIERNEIIDARNSTLKELRDRVKELEVQSDAMKGVIGDALDAFEKLTGNKNGCLASEIEWVAQRYASLKGQLQRLINSSASLLAHCPELPALSAGGTAQSFLKEEIKLAKAALG